MSKEFGEIDYDENAALHGGGNFPEYNGMGRIGESTEINLIYADKDIAEEDEDDITPIQYEARFAAERIKRLIDDGFEVFDSKENGYRRIKLSDIVILLRSDSNVSGVFAKELMEAGIDAYADKSENFLDSMEIMTIISFLQTIDNPYQDIPVLSVLKSPVYRVDGNSLLEISLEGEGECFYEKILSFSETEKGAYLKSFIGDIRRWKAYAKFIPSDMLIWKIYRETGYFDYVGAESKGKIKQGRLRALIDIASEFEKNTFKGLFKFLQYILNSKSIYDGGDKSGANNENVVRIMSIHKSKGLEFPVVFISNISKEFFRRDLNSRVLFHNKIGIGAPYIDAENRIVYNSAAQTVLKQKLLSEKLAEELRILYVAMTRAKEKLIFTGYIKNIESSAYKWGITAGDGKELSSYSLRKCTSFADWIMPAIMVHKDAEVLRELCLLKNMRISDDESNWDINLIPENKFSFCEDLGDEKEGEVSDKEPFGDEKVREVLLWKYPFEKECRIPSCMSISEIKKKYMEYMGEENEERIYRKDDTEKVMLKSDELTYAQKGTVMHTVMEHLDFKKGYDRNALDLFIKDLVSKGILSEKEAESVNREKVLRFLKSPLGKRAAVSDRVYKEESFAMEFKPSEIYMAHEYPDTDEGTIIHGIIDCYFYEEDEIVLFDYKTDYVEKGKEAEAAKKYEIQLSVYKKVLEASTGKRVKEVYIYFFFNDKELKLSL